MESTYGCYCTGCDCGTPSSYYSSYDSSTDAPTCAPTASSWFVATQPSRDITWFGGFNYTVAWSIPADDDAAGDALAIGLWPVAVKDAVSCGDGADEGTDLGAPRAVLARGARAASGLHVWMLPSDLGALRSLSGGAFAVCLADDDVGADAGDDGALRPRACARGVAVLAPSGSDVTASVASWRFALALAGALALGVACVGVAGVEHFLCLVRMRVSALRTTAMPTRARALSLEQVVRARLSLIDRLRRGGVVRR